MTAFDIVCELALFAPPFYMIVGLQMATKMKLKVIGALSVRLLILIPIFLHLFAVPPFYRLSDGETVTSYSMSRPYIYTQIALTLAIVTPTIPLLQPFVQATTTTFGMVSGNATNSYGSGKFDIRRTRSIGISKTTSVHQAVSSRSYLEDQAQDMSREGGDQYSASGVLKRRLPGNSNVSQQPMIRHDQDYIVSYANGPSS